MQLNEMSGLSERLKLLTLASFLVISTSAASASSQSGSVLDFAYGEYQNAPYVFEKSATQSKRGIMLDISSELAKRIPFEIRQINLPRKRTEQFLEEGVVDIRCHLSPYWVENAEQYSWTDPLYSLDTVIVTQEQNPKTITDVSALEGELIGTIHGYRYSQEIVELLEFYEAQQIQTSSLENALQMLSMGRVTAVIGNHILANYLIAKMDLHKTLKIHPFIVRKQNIHCALSKNADVDTSLVLEALHGMKSEGVFEDILSSYFMPLQAFNPDLF